MFNPRPQQSRPVSTVLCFAVPSLAQNPTMRLDQLRLLFEAGTFMAAEIVPLEPSTISGRF